MARTAVNRWGSSCKTVEEEESYQQSELVRCLSRVILTTNRVESMMGRLNIQVVMDGVDVKEEKGFDVDNEDNELLAVRSRYHQQQSQDSVGEMKFSAFEPPIRAARRAEIECSGTKVNAALIRLY